MKFRETKIPGVFEIHLEPIFDERVFFGRKWCQKEFEAHGLNSRVPGCETRILVGPNRSGSRESALVNRAAYSTELVGREPRSVSGDRGRSSSRVVDPWCGTHSFRLKVGPTF